jgi:tetratricopeptide (TPR) repeat protein
LLRRNLALNANVLPTDCAVRGVARSQGKARSLLPFSLFHTFLFCLFVGGGCRFSPTRVAGNDLFQGARMKLFLAAAAIAATTAAHAAPQIQQVIYNVDAASKCSAAANGQAALKDGLAACNTALSDPAMNHRAALLLDRGVIQVRLGNNKAAFLDYSSAIALDSNLGDAYVSRAGLLVALKRYDEARADIAQGMALNASNMHVAYYSRAAIEEEAGDVKAAYRDYKAALAIKPDFAPAIRELARFKVVNRSAKA